MDDADGECSDDPLTPAKLVELNTFSLGQMAFIWLAIEHNQSILFAGPTASGKTTSMNASSMFLPPNEKVVSIERVREISIPHDNHLSYVTRESQSGTREDISMYDILQSVLHERPEYILVGEIRTDPLVARTFFQSIYTGHSGGTTFHADSASSVVNRLTSDPIGLGEQMVPAIDLIVIQKRRSTGGGSPARRAVSVSEFRTPESGTRPVPKQIFKWNPETDMATPTIESYTDSVILQDIAAANTWSEHTLINELTKRRDVLAYLVETGRTDYETVVDFIYRFYRDESWALETARSTNG